MRISSFGCSFAFAIVVLFSLECCNLQTLFTIRGTIRFDDTKQPPNCDSDVWSNCVILRSATRIKVVNRNEGDCGWTHYLDSTGVDFRNGEFRFPTRYKLFTDKHLWRVVRERLSGQLLESGTILPKTTIKLCLAIGKRAGKCDQKGMESHFAEQSWKLFQPEWIIKQLEKAATQGYENDIAFVVAKLLQRTKSSEEP